MKNNLAKRLERVLNQDKSQEPNKLLPALKSDIRDVLRCYAELNGDIVLEVEESTDGYSVVMVAKTIRFKA